jgi:predicted amidohydrolase
MPAPSLFRRRISVPAFLFCLLAACLPAAGTGEGDGVLRVGAVQFAVSPERYMNHQVLKDAINDVLDRLEDEAASSGYGMPLDLAVFPEYSSAFLGLVYLSEGELKALQSAPENNRDIIVRVIREAAPDVEELWTEIASERGYSILAGTVLSAGNDGTIWNRALLYHPENGLVWSQDKSFPGFPEERILQLAAGRPEDTRPFEIDGHTVVMTICRDTYSDVWEEVFPEADLWIDIKANELTYTREYYDEALPSRLPKSRIHEGLTVSLSGEMMGYRFTGVTEHINRIGTLKSTSPNLRDAVMVITIP